MTTNKKHQNPWKFFIKGAIFALLFFVVIAIISLITFPKTSLGFEGILNILLIYLAAFVAGVIFLLTFTISLKRKIFGIKKSEVSLDEYNVETLPKKALLLFALLIGLAIVSIGYTLYDKNSPEQYMQGIDYNTPYNESRLKMLDEFSRDGALNKVNKDSVLNGENILE